MTTAVGVAADPRARRREQRGWYFYDWANSTFSTTVLTVFLGPYLTDLTKAAAGPGGFVHPLGVPVRAGSYFPYLVSLSVILSVLVLPVVGAVTDRTEHKRLLLAFFAYVGAVATMAMFFLRGSNYLFGGGLFLIANIAFGASVVIYYSYLPLISTPDERDAVSSRGWALGYVGGFVLLVANLALFLRHSALGLSSGAAVRICLASAGAWWAVFTVIPLLTLRPHPPQETVPPGASALTAGFRQLGRTLAEARGYRLTLLFLVGYLLYNDGIQTVIALASQYAQEELGLSQTVRISAIVIVQFLAIFGALLLGRLARTYGAQRTVLASLVVWVLVVAASFFLPAHAPTAFYVLAGFIGLVLGGSQALSRSLFSQLIPAGKEAEYFSLYEISSGGTSWIGPLLFGLVYQLTGSYRGGIVSLVVFFAAGFAVLARVPMARAVRAVGNPVPDRL